MNSRVASIISWVAIAIAASDLAASTSLFQDWGQTERQVSSADFAGEGSILRPSRFVSDSDERVSTDRMLGGCDSQTCVAAFALQVLAFHREGQQPTGVASAADYFFFLRLQV
ncbi:MAG: hypothetical protein SFU86_10180 [Pirellulaceae bacterium]|nr:hypothetical protein [Pirellulaceae bacterium]